MEIILIERIGVAGVKILLTLKVKGEAHIREIIREAGVGYTSTYRALHDLSELGLIEEQISGTKRIIKLSKKGQLVAEKLEEIEKILRSKI